MKRKWTTLLLTLYLILALAACTSAGDTTASSVPSDLPSQDTLVNQGYINLGNDNVPSLTSVVGERSLTQMDVNTYPSGETSATIAYSADTSEQAANDMQQYVNYLITAENFTSFHPEGKSMGDSTYTMYSLNKDSIDAGMVIVLTLSSSPDGCLIDAMKMPAALLEKNSSENALDNPSAKQ